MLVVLFCVPLIDLSQKLFWKFQGCSSKEGKRKTEAVLLSVAYFPQYSFSSRFPW